MVNIQVLDQITIDKIAAGEVIERPASIIKELVENAIDAGASAVTVEIKEGGISFIRITDNGCGIPKGEVPLAFLRHSTSKIRSVDDLSTVASLGFRGEALSSIAAIAQVELITKTKDEVTGTRYRIEGGAEKSIEDTGAPDGTTFLVHQIFYNTPARRKFLKTPMTEASHVSELMTRLALSHPEVSIQFINNGQEKLHTSGNGKLKDIIIMYLGGILPIIYWKPTKGLTEYRYRDSSENRSSPAGIEITRTILSTDVMSKATSLQRQSKMLIKILRCSTSIRLRRCTLQWTEPTWMSMCIRRRWNFVSAISRACTILSTML